MNWTKDKVALLLTLHEEGKTGAEIAKIMGENLTRNAILGKLHRLRGQSKAKVKKVKSTAAPVGRGWKGLETLDKDRCHWPLETTFCGGERLKGAYWPYCETHLLAARRKC